MIHSLAIVSFDIFGLPADLKFTILGTVNFSDDNE